MVCCEVVVSLMSCARTTASIIVQCREKTMKFMFGRREKFLYRRNTVYASFISGTKFGLVLAALVYFAIKLM